MIMSNMKKFSEETERERLIKLRSFVYQNRLKGMGMGKAKKKTMKEFVEELAESLRLVEASNDKTYSMDIDNEDGDPKGDKALHNAHKHFVKMGYKISHESGDDSISKKVKQPDITYHYGHGDDTHHAFTIHKGGKVASDPHIKHLTKHLTDTSEGS